MMGVVVVCGVVKHTVARATPGEIGLGPCCTMLQAGFSGLQKCWSFLRQHSTCSSTTTLAGSPKKRQLERELHSPEMEMPGHRNGKIVESMNAIATQIQTNTSRKAGQSAYLQSGAKPN